MSGKLTKAAEETNDRLTVMSKSIDGVLLRAVAKAMPYIEAITKKMVAWAKQPDKITKALNVVITVMKSFATVGVAVYGAIEAIGYAIASLAAAATLVAQGEFSKAWDVIQQGAEDSDKAWADAWKNIDEMWKDTPKEIASKSDQAAEAMASPVVKAGALIEDSAKDIDKKIKEIQKKIQSATKEAASINKEFTGRSEALTGGKGKKPEELNVLDVSHLQRQAEKSLRGGDFDGAVKKARQAFDLLDKMKEAGVESDIVLKGMGERLRRLGEKIGTEKIKSAAITVEVDQQAAIDSAMQANNAMQAALSAKPLTQIINMVPNGATSSAPTGIDPAIVPNDAVQKSEAKPNLQPVNITMPGGETIPFYGDARGIDDMQRGLQREALKRGTR